MVTMRELAMMGAKARIKELAEESASLAAQFPELSGGDAPSTARVPGRAVPKASARQAKPASGRQFSEETRRKMSESQRKRRQKTNGSGELSTQPVPGEDATQSLGDA